MPPRLNPSETIVGHAVMTPRHRPSATPAEAQVSASHRDLDPRMGQDRPRRARDGLLSNAWLAQSPRPRALFVVFAYPPYNSIGAVWASKMSRYLLALGWDVTVLTTERAKQPANLPVELPPERIVRAPFLDVNALARRLLGRKRMRARDLQIAPLSRGARVLGELYRSVVNFPDAQIGWYPGAIRTGRRLLRELRPDVVMSSSPYPTSHVVAHRLSRESGIPWVAEFRDPWTGSDRSRFRAWPLSALERALERRIVGDAAAIVTVSRKWAEEYRRSFPSVPVHFVSNRFDSADYGPVVSLRSSRTLLLLYTGGFYRGDPRPLFSAVGRLLRRGMVSADEIRLRFIGPHPGAVLRASRASGLPPDVVEIRDEVSQREALTAQQAAHGLVLFLEDDPGWRPAKLYEYLGAHRPILIVGGSEHHEAACVVAETDAGMLCPSVEDIETRIAAWVRELRATGSIAYRGNADAIARFERRNLAQQVDRILRKTIQAEVGARHFDWARERPLEAD